MHLRTIIVLAILAAAALAAAAGGVASSARDTGPAHEATPSTLSAGPYTAVVRRITTPDGARAVIDLTDASGRAVAGKPVSGILVYAGTAAGHEHHDILIGQDQGGGRYALAFNEAAPGPWLLTIFVGDEGRAAYLFAVP